MSALDGYFPSSECPWPPHPLLNELRKDNQDLKRFYSNYQALIIRIIQFMQHPDCFEWIHIQDIRRFRENCLEYINGHVFARKNLTILTNECLHLAMESMQMSYEKVNKLKPLSGWNFLKL